MRFLTLIGLLLSTTVSAKSFNHSVEVQVGGTEKKAEFKWGSVKWEPGKPKTLNYDCRKSTTACYWNDQGVTGFQDIIQPISIKSNYPIQVKFKAGVINLAKGGNPETCDSRTSNTCRRLKLFWGMQGEDFKALHANQFVPAHKPDQRGEFIPHRLKLTQDGRYDTTLLSGNDYKSTQKVELIFSEQP